MKLKRLELSQVRGFEQAEFTFQPDMNLLVGVNGAGKSTVLDVLRILLSRIVPRFSSVRGKPESFSENDIRIGRGALTAHLDFTVANKDFHFLAHIPRLDHVVEQTREGQVREQTYSLQDYYELSPQTGFTMPNEALAVYFSTLRSVYSFAKPPRASSAPGEAAAFAEALESRQLRIREFAEWWLVQESLAKEMMFASFGRDMEVLSEMVSYFLDGCTNLRAVSEPHVTLLVDKEDGVLDVRQLSDGERNLLAMVLDLARRLAILNPYIENPLASGEAIVLIDEIDLHLHPRWQRDIIGKLTRTFPKCQFIATTHSPQILGEVSPEQIILIEHGNVFKPNQSLGMDTNWILQFLMGTAPRPEETQQELDIIADLIEDEAFDEAERLINELRDELGDFPELVKLQTRLDRMRILGI